MYIASDGINDRRALKRSALLPLPPPPFGPPQPGMVEFSVLASQIYADAAARRSRTRAREVAPGRNFQSAISLIPTAGRATRRDAAPFPKTERSPVLRAPVEPRSACTQSPPPLPSPPLLV